MEESNQKLDEAFDQFLVDMKPQVLRLPHKSERQQCALWIKKLCESPGSGTTGRKNRNMYAKLLIHMLKKGVLEGPFLQRPERGPLPTLPTYMSIFFDEPSRNKSPRMRDSDAKSPPDWVNGELMSEAFSGSSQQSTRGFGEPSATSTLRERYREGTGVDLHRNEDALPGNRRTGTGNLHNGCEAQVVRGRDEIRSKHKASFTFSSDEDESDQRHRERPVRRKSKSPTARNALSDTNIEMGAYTHEWRLPSNNYQTTATKTSRYTAYSRADNSSRDEAGLLRQHEKELEMRTKMTEAKFHEEKLGIQQRHDEAIQKILDRKNTEMEEMKSHYRSKTREMEETIRKLEKKAQNQSKEIAMMRENKDKQIAELKKMVDQSSMSTHNEFEKQLHDAIADFEQEKFEMQKQHTKAIQEILDDTNARLHKMEEEYSTQVEDHASVIQELEARIQQLTMEAETHTSSKTQISQQKEDLEMRNTRLSKEIETLRNRYSVLEKDLVKSQEDHSRETRTLRNKMDATVEFLKQEHALAMNKATDTIHELEQHVQELKKSVQESEHQRQRQLRELEAELKQDRTHLETLQEKKLSSVKAELDQERQDSHRQRQKLEQVIREKDQQLSKLGELQRLQSQQAEHALEDFKSQVERNSGKMFDDMKKQMCQVEADLAQSKELREKQAREFARQQDEQNIRHQQQITDIQRAHEQEKNKLLQYQRAEKESLQMEHSQAIEDKTEQLHYRLELTERQSQEQQEKDAKAMSELEHQVRDLREELIQGNSLRKQQLVELGLLREEEKQKANREYQTMVSQLQSEMEQTKLRLQKEHGAEMERTLQQTNDRLKGIEKEYTQRLEKSNETVRNLQDKISALKEQTDSSRQRLQQEVEARISRIENEKDVLREEHAAYLKSLHQDVDKQQGHMKQLERRLTQQQLDHQEQMTRLKQEYTDKMRGLMPATVQQELENTITSLKTQVNMLQKRAALLEEEVDLNKTRLPGGFSSTPIRT
ncbi:LOW QUALITY PROTEIN: centrosomal protein of 112 kDa-like [Amphiura filiformis]|uniref:LOW QUALITY PROTEIN: centrosomal protein of 112 kDa-like n=1 Tax=Amphiura filiformis TaxID=82378 RepID=UPI003B212E78